jgi:putative endonuclease
VAGGFFKEHQQVAEGGKKGAKFFRSDPPATLVYRELCPNRSEASKREAAIKQLTRKEKLALISAT